MKKDSRTFAVVFLLMCVVTVPLFFDTYRIMAFNAIPRDDYARFLLRLTSQAGSWPLSPTGYRLLSVLPALPFYWLLPVYRFSLLSNVDPAYLRATQALAFLSFVSTALAAAVAFQFVKNKFAGTMTQASFSALLTTLLIGYTGRTGIEPLAVATIFALLYVLELPLVFSLLVIPSAFVNEKIPMFFLFLAVSRSALVPRFFKSHRWQIASVAAALGLYVTALITIRLPGNEYQTAVADWIPHSTSMFIESFSSFKAFQLNVFPALIVTTPLIAFSLYSRRPTQLVAASDFLVPLGLLWVALAGTVGVTVGRVVALAIPLTVLSLSSLMLQHDEP